MEVGEGIRSELGHHKKLERGDEISTHDNTSRSKLNKSGGSRESQARDGKATNENEKKFYKN